MPFKKSIPLSKSFLTKEEQDNLVYFIKQQNPKCDLQKIRVSNLGRGGKFEVRFKCKKKESDIKATMTFIEGQFKL